MSEKADVHKTFEDYLANEESIQLVGLVESGQEGLLLAEQHYPDMSFIDSSLPESSIEVAAKLRKLLPECAIVMMSVANDPNRIRRARLAGEDNFLSKPILQDELVRVINHYRANSELFTSHRLINDSPLYLQCLIAEISDSWSRGVLSIDKDFLADDVVFVTSGGQVLDKPQYLDANAANRWPHIHLKFEDLFIQILGDAAITRGRYSESQEGSVREHGYLLYVFAKRDAQWQMIAGQHTQIA